MNLPLWCHQTWLGNPIIFHREIHIENSGGLSSHGADTGVGNLHDTRYVWKW